MIFGKALLTNLSVLLLLVNACSFKGSDSKKPDGVENAGFSIGPIMPLTSHSVTSDPNWGVPSSRAFELRAKVLDSATLAPRVGEKFLLWRENNSELLQVDAEGWIKWTEVISFLSLAPERLIPISRRVSGKMGTQIVRFAINPWSETLDFVDLTHQQDHKSNFLVPESESEDALKGLSQYRPEKHTPQSGSNLVVEKLDLNIGEPKSNRSRWLEVAFHVYATRQKRDLSFAKVSLPSGHFRVALKFLQQDDKRNEQRQWAGLSGTEVAVNQGKITLKTELPITDIPEDTAQLKLHYLLEPVEPTVGILPAQGELLLNARSGRMSGVPVEQPLHYEMSVSLERNEVETKSFVARRWSARFGGEESYDPSSWRTTDLVNAEICVVDPLSRFPISNRPFQVGISETADAKGVSLTEVISDLDGCLNWTGTLSFFKGQGEQYLDRYLVAKGVKPPYQEDVVMVAVAFNPWQRGELYFRDVQRKGKMPLLKTDRRPAMRSKGFRYGYENPTFETNSHLQLITHRQYQATMQVGLFRPANLSGNEPPEALREGTRLSVRGLLLHPLFVDKSRRGQTVERPVLAGFKVPGVVDAHSDINFVINLPTEFTQGALLDARTKLLIEIATETPSENLPAPVIYSGPFKAVAGQSDLGETPFNDTEFTPDQFSQLWANGAKSGKGYQYASQAGVGHSFASFTVWKRSPMDLFTYYWQKQGPLDLVSIGSEVTKGWRGTTEWNTKLPSANSLLSRFSAGESVSGEVLDQFLGWFCHQLGKNHTQCLTGPRNYFHISTMEIVDSVPDSRLSPPSVSTPLFQVSASYFREYMFSKRDLNGRRQIREHAEAKSSTVGAGLFNNGIAYTRSYINQDEFFDTTEAGVQDDLRSRLQMQEQLNLSGEGKRFEFVARSRRCLMVRPTAAVSTVYPAARAHLFCGDPILNTVNESWYYIWDQWRQLSSSHVDPRDPWERGWMKLIRGVAEYEHFKSSLSDGVRFFVFKKVEPYYAGVDSLVETAFQTNHGVRFQEDGGIFPGVTHYRELSPLKWTEQQIERYVSLCEGPNEPNPKTATEKEIRSWRSLRKYCRCYYENAAQLSPHGEFVTERKNQEETLNQMGVPKLCSQFGASL